MKNKWFRLDNVAKIFPPTSTKRDPKVFRFVCELTEEVDEAYLQTALDKTLELFPGFQTLLKQGIFWYFLETTDLKPVVSEETLPPCASLYDHNSKTLLFRVIYYKKRINLEVYHALTDGTGAMEFLKVLIHFYVTGKYFTDKKAPALAYDATDVEKMTDSFIKYYDSKKSKQLIPEKKSYQFKGEKLEDNRFLITEGYLKVSEVLKLAHEYNTTITTFLTAVYMKAIYQDMSLKDRKKPVIVSIPVNLRKYFASVTARNFFSIVNISYSFNDNSDDLNDIIENIKAQLKYELEPEYIEAQMNKFAALEHNFIVKFIPLFIKNFILKVSALISDFNVTCCVSNLGQTALPEEFSPYVKKLAVYISTPKQQMCVCSYNDELTVGLTSVFVSTNVTRNFFRILTDLGLETTVSSNQTYK